LLDKISPEQTDGQTDNLSWQYRGSVQDLPKRQSGGARAFNGALAAEASARSRGKPLQGGGSGGLKAIFIQKVAKS